MSLCLFCPYCKAAHEDDWEVLDVLQLDDKRCDACQRPFWFFVLDCGHCGQETVLTWPQRPDETTINHLKCKHCGHLIRPKDPPLDDTHVAASDETAD
jgi:DNA-directed RNA polymerase subunit RPC12/RpoP